MTTLSDGVNTITPTIVDGFTTSQSSRTVLHDIIGRPDQDASLMADGLRSGSLRCVFEVEADADAARQHLAKPSRWTLADADRSSIAMTFVRQGELSLELDDESRDVWILTVGYQEVLA
jgi:hypothetical protein